jgi:hypothetical protein
MDISKMLDELRQERAAVEEAILTLERLAQGQGRRRGRPPAWMAELKKKHDGDAPALISAPARKPRTQKAAGAAAGQ